MSDYAVRACAEGDYRWLGVRKPRGHIPRIVAHALGAYVLLDQLEQLNAWQLRGVYGDLGVLKMVTDYSVREAYCNVLALEAEDILRRLLREDMSIATFDPQQC